MRVQDTRGSGKASLYSDIIGEQYWLSPLEGALSEATYIGLPVSTTPYYTDSTTSYPVRNDSWLFSWLLRADDLGDRLRNTSIAFYTIFRDVHGGFSKMVARLSSSTDLGCIRFVRKLTEKGLGDIVRS